MPLISVIIPVYNAESTLKRCVNSIINQDFEDYELILVNDGSTDSSAMICEELSLKEKVQYVCKENGGVSSARNIGIKEATGQYITFVDSDDYVSSNYFSVISESLKENDDILMFSLNLDENGKISLKKSEGFYSNNTDEISQYISKIICSKRINSPCTKVYKKSIIDNNNILFDERLHIGEDKCFSLQYCLNVSSFKTISDCLYYACVDSDNSLSRRINEDIDSQRELFYSLARQALSKSVLEDRQKEKIKDALNFLVYSEVYSDAKKYRISKKSTSERIRMIYRRCKEIRNQKLSYPNTRYCKIICIPVKLGLISVVDLVSWKLAK